MPPTPHAATQPSLVRRALNVALMGVYVAAIYFACDFVYTKFLYETDRLGRIAHDDYHHGLMANFEGYETWGRLREQDLHQQPRLQGRQDPRRAREVRWQARASDRRFVHRGRRAGVRATLRRHAVSGRTESVRRKSNSSTPASSPTHPPSTTRNQIPARRRASSSTRSWCFRICPTCRTKRCPISASTRSLNFSGIAPSLPTTQPPNRTLTPVPGRHALPEDRSEVQGPLRHDGPAAADVLA